MKLKQLSSTSNFQWLNLSLLNAVGKVQGKECTAYRDSAFITGQVALTVTRDYLKTLHMYVLLGSSNWN